MKIKRELAACAIVGIGVFVAWAGWSVFETSNQVLPSSVRDLPDFMNTMPTPDAVNRIEVGGSLYYEVIGPMAPMSTAPSGPPVYIFGEDMSVVDWTIDSGEDSRFEARWKTDSRVKILPEELLQLIDANSN